jgi:CheY-like chemotaxis protein
VSIESKLENKKILLVDDDARNLYALTVVLEEYDCELLIANNGRECLAFLDQHDDIDCVLMDIMMPEMDGYEAMGHIRKQPKFENLPIIALTAKAMKEDRSKCLDAGANNYISKPINTNELLAMMAECLQ